MTEIRNQPLTRQQIQRFMPDDRSVRAFEAMQADIQSIGDDITNASFLTLTAEPSLGSERIMSPVAGQLTATDGGPNGPYSLGLADTAVTPGTYGGAGKLVSITLDGKGRATAASDATFNTDNVPEGGTNLYFTTARARASVSASSPLVYNSSTGQFSISGAAITKSDDTNVTLTLGGSPSTAALASVSFTLGWSGQLSVSRGGTGTGTAFTSGSVVFAGGSGVYSQDNADLFWDNTNKRLGVGTASPVSALHVDGGLATVGRYATSGAMVLRRAEGSSGSPTAVSGASAVSTLVSRGYDGSAYRDVASITVNSDGAISGSSSPGSIAFSTTPSGSTATVTRMLISSAGNISAQAGFTTMTDGFFYIPAAAGAPTGVPTSVSGGVPMYYDTTNDHFYVYRGGWKKVLLS